MWGREVFSELPSTSQFFVSLCFWSRSIKNASHFPTCLAEARLEEKGWGMFLPQQEGKNWLESQVSYGLTRT